MRKIKTTIDIHARPRDVWKVLANTDAYKSWNPFIRSFQGDLKDGSRVKVVLQSGAGKAMTFRPIVLVADKEREIRWIGHLLFPRLFDGEHRFAIEPIEKEHVRFIQEERFKGALVPLLMNARMKKQTEQSFVEMNEALKRKVEA